MLPKIDVPVYEIKLPSTGEFIKFRPFTVKEEKLFLMAYESDDAKYSVDTIIQVLNNCIISDIDIKDLPTFDIEYLFLNIRARSIGEIVKLRYRCNNDVGTEEDPKKCNSPVEIELNVLEIDPIKSLNHSNKIEINDKLGIFMKYPKMNLIKDNTDVEDFNVESREFIFNDERFGEEYIYSYLSFVKENFISNSLPANIGEQNGKPVINFAKLNRRVIFTLEYSYPEIEAKLKNINVIKVLSK